MVPAGRTRVELSEKQTMLDMRLSGYSIRQIVEFTGRSTSTVKRIIYNWPKQNRS